MNLPLRRLGTVIGVMLIALMISTTTIQFFQASSLNTDARNVRTIYRGRFGRDRGPIIVGDQSVAWSEPIDDVYAFQRILDRVRATPMSPATSPPAFNASTGIERWSNDVLGGTADSLLLSRIQDLFTGRQPQRGSVELTSTPSSSRWPRTRSRASAAPSSPSTRPPAPSSRSTSSRASTRTRWPPTTARRPPTRGRPSSPTPKAAGEPGTGTILYPPGSTFKVLVTAAWLELDPTRTATSTVPTPAELQLPQSTSIIRNPGQTSCGGADTGELVYAFKESCNTTFAQLAMDLGEQQLAAITEDFGSARPEHPPEREPVDLPGHRLGDAEVALTGIGQFDVRVSALQMAMVAAAVANDGTLMRPHLVATERDADLAVINPHRAGGVLRAHQRRDGPRTHHPHDRRRRVRTGTPAAVPGVTVAGKTARRRPATSRTSTRG